jgi:chromosome segregation ATPase
VIYSPRKRLVNIRVSGYCGSNLLQQILSKLDSLEKGQANLLKAQANLEEGQANLEEGQANLEEGQANLVKGQANLEKGQANLEKGQAATNEEIRLIHSQLKEHGAILGALQHASEVHKADIDNLTHQVAGVSGEVKAIRTVQADHTEQLDRIENKVAGHDIKIEVLDRTKANKSKIK